MYLIKWQKRGLPHTHILILLDEKIVLTQIDNIITAQLPDPEEDPELFKITKKHITHGPYRLHNPYSPCVTDGKCTKKYPRQMF